MKIREIRGYILWESSTVVCIATMKSGNVKTGNMVQVWIIRNDYTPNEALRNGMDVSVCGDCPLRGKLGENRTCYVNLGHAPHWVYDGYVRGIYPIISDWSVFEKRTARFGAYGDPAMVPTSVWVELSNHVTGWTGYTHQWRQPTAQGLRGLVMASCDTVDQQIEAVKKGWRTFRVRSDDTILPNEIDCPAPKVQCEDCKLCCGTSLNARNITVKAHGKGKKNLDLI